MNKPNLSVMIGDVKLNNPVIAASGTFGFGREYGEYIDLNKLGGIAVKGLTLLPRQGNKSPRIAETPSGILNSVGLENPGVKAFIKNEIPFLKQYQSKIIANIAGSTVDDYIKMVETLNNTSVDLYEINLSCPNVKEGCLAFGSSKNGVYNVTKAIKKIAKKPIIIKLTPNVTDITAIALGAQEGGADAISLINTITGMKIDTKTKRPILNNNIGGLSGPCIRPIAVRMVHQVYQTVNIPIIGMGGITNLQDALEFFIAGARAIMIGTYHFMDPYVSEKVIVALEQHLVDNNIGDIKELIGSLILNE